MPRTFHALEREVPSDTSYIHYSKEDIIYPESDGRPMSDNTKQFNWIVKIKEGLEVMFAHRPDVFVAGDLLWYPVKGKIDIRAAPDAMVVFGRPKGDRGSYIQHKEENIAPQVVFEVMSPGNTKKEMKEKLGFYNRHSVEEYYLYDPDEITLEGWMRTNGKFLKIKKIQDWTSPRLGIRFELTDDNLIIYRPDGQKFLSFIETEAKVIKAEKLSENEKQQREKAQKIAQNEKQQREKSQKIAQKERKQKEKAQKLAQQAEARAEMLAAKLRELGIPIESL